MPLPISLYLTGQAAPAFFSSWRLLHLSLALGYADLVRRKFRPIAAAGPGLPAAARFFAGTPFRPALRISLI